MNKYKILKHQVQKKDEFSIVPIRMKDRISIMNWRNEQLYHLRQKQKLTKKEQDYYFKNVVSNLFNNPKPKQILFSFLHKETLVGYGGLVHINWIDKNAEISFVMDTKLEKKYFLINWCVFLNLIEYVAFNDLMFHKIYTYAYDLRPRIYEALEKSNFYREAVLKDHCNFNNKFIDVIIHSKINNQ